MTKSKRNKRDNQPRLFRGNPDYKAEFERAVTELISAKILDRAERMTTVQSLIDEYVMAVGERPDWRQLERLTNEILREELTDDHPDKMARNDYPIMSDRQRIRRRGNETTFDVAENIGTDGRNHNLPKRRKLTTKESLFIDKIAKIRNAERRRKYREFTKPGDVETYRLNEERCTI